MSGFLAQDGGTTSEFLADHGAHVLVLGGPVVVLAGLFAMLELTRPDRPRRGADGSISWLALTWAAAGTLHLAVIAEHFEESALLGSFFVLLSLAQYGYAFAVILRSSRRLLLLGLVANMSVVLLWAWTRAVSVPFGLGPREPAGVLDLAATGLELGAVVLTWIALRRSSLLAAGAESGREALTSEVAGTASYRT
ncbi:MAG: hypothetical protein NTX33_01950 [Propionibacteriales bacterium]|nr:hypothetical protein [Propionibacteriales bacterium]